MFLAGFFGGPKSPLLDSTDSASYDWTTPSNLAGHQSGKSAEGSINALATSDDQASSVFDPNSRAYPFMIALVVINGVFVVGILAAILMYFSRSRKQSSYVSTGAKNAPR